MTTKELIVQELDQVPESALSEILEYVRCLKQKLPQSLPERIWQSYLDSEQEREEVYQRLADS
jgi:anaerobic ribonucleoside-triphosphate reductase